MKGSSLLYSLGSVLTFVYATHAKHVLVIIADDFGWADVSFHNSGGIKTPNIDKLVGDGLELTNYYTQHICTPTRSALLTGRYPIHTGLQTNVIAISQPSGLQKDEKLLPEYLESCDIKQRHMVGKWHVGHGHDWMTPWKRGFETFSGYLAGAEDHYTREWCMEQTDWCGVDYAEHYASFSGPTNATWGEYSGDLYLRKMSRIVETIDPTKDSFVYFAPQHVHYPLQALQRHLVKYSWIKDTNRRNYAAMVASLDEMIGDVVALYRKNGLLENTIGFFVADNGGETRDGGNNWPLSGQKWTLLEGGLKATGFMFGGLVPLGKYNGLFHVSDILPTVMEAFDCPIDNKMDGHAQWGAIIKRKAFPRSELLHNIDPTKINKVANDSRTWSSDWDVRVQAALRKGPWKLITGDPGFTSDEVPEFPVPPPEWHQQEPYKTTTRGHISQITGKSADYHFENDRNKLVRLYKIDEDPTESRDISDQNLSIVEEMLNILMKYNSTMVPPQLPDLDPLSNPKLHKGFWFPWISDKYNSKKQML